MHFYFLDVVDAGVSSSIDWMLILVLAITIVVEALVMLLLKYNSFKKSLLDAFVVNVASILVGFLLLKFAHHFFNSYDIPGLLKLLVITIAIELPILYLLNRKHPFVKTIQATVLINIVTYVLFFGFTQLFNR
jgi:hypothetical protein